MENNLDLIFETKFPTHENALPDSVFVALIVSKFWHNFSRRSERFPVASKRFISLLKVKVGERDGSKLVKDENCGRFGLPMEKQKSVHCCCYSCDVGGYGSPNSVLLF